MNFSDYFQSYRKYFWQWEEEGRIISIPDGRTIAYATYVLHFLNYLKKEHPVPRFSTLLLAILATSRDAEYDTYRLIYNLRNAIPGLNAYHLDALEKGQKFLLELTHLPPQYKEGKNRWLLMQTIFQPLSSPVKHSWTPEISAVVARGSLEREAQLPPQDITPEVLYSDFHPFIKLGKTFPDAASILNAMEGLPEWHEELPLSEARTDPGGDFLQELLHNPDTAEIGALIPRIWSALEIPLHNRLPGQQPLGGIAGLSNKGEAHQLLASEFAHDDTVFLSRLANQEALYLQREKPLQSDNRERVLLLDTSVKNWGTPHTIGFALMLAIARHPKSDIPCSAYALHHGWKPLPFNDIHQIIQGLLVLEPCLHPAEGMERFFRDNPDKLNAEVFLLTTNNTLRLPAMQQILARFQPALSYWLLSDHQGRVDLYKKWGQGKRHVKSFQLPQDKLWEKITGRYQKEPVNLNSSLPPAHYPILFPSPKRVITLLSAGGQVYGITVNHALMRRAQKPSKCWEMLYEDLPQSFNYYEMGIMESGHPVLLGFSSLHKNGFLLNVTTGEVKWFSFLEWKRESPHRGFVFKDDWFYCPGDETPYWFSFHETPSPEWTDNPTVLNNMVKQWLAEKESNLSSLYQHLHFPERIVKNITRVGISREGNLLLNHVELHLHNNEFSLTTYSDDTTTMVYKSTNTGENEFSFPGGNLVSLHPNGLVTLINLNLPIPPIYFPTVADIPLGLATRDSFCGNEMFLPPAPPLRRLNASAFFKNFLYPFTQTCK